MPKVSIEFTASEVRDIIAEHIRKNLNVKGVDSASSFGVDYVNGTGQVNSVVTVRVGIVVPAGSNTPSGYHSDIRESGMGFRD